MHVNKALLAIYTLVLSQVKFFHTVYVIGAFDLLDIFERHDMCEHHNFNLVININIKINRY